MIDLNESIQISKQPWVYYDAAPPEYQKWLNSVKNTINLEDLVSIWEKSYKEKWHIDLMQYALLKRLYQITQPNPMLYLHLQITANNTSWATIEEADGKYLIEAFFFFPDNSLVLYERLLFLLYQNYQIYIIRNALKLLQHHHSQETAILSKCQAFLNSQPDQEIARMPKDITQELLQRRDDIFIINSSSFLRSLKLKLGY